MITILDYGINNLSSVVKAIHFLGYQCRVAKDLSGASKLIIPGVGAFGAAMERLRPIREDIRAFAASGNPLLGICLGQQLLLESSEEHGEFEGLGLIPGRVRYLPKMAGLKVPHIGWSQVEFGAPSLLGQGFESGQQVYFVHSLYVDCGRAEDAVGFTDHGIRFASVIEYENVFGTQFHPEKSGSVGLHMLGNFLAC